MDKLGCETSELKESHALDKFREWIEKHPKIKKCRTDDQYLIRFLRMSKFNILEACQLLETYLTSRKEFPHLFENLNIASPELEDFVNSHCALQLPEVDSQGRIVLFLDPEPFSAKRWTAVDCMRMTNLCLEHFSFDESSQTKGIVTVMDSSGENYDFARLWTPTRLKECTQCLQKTFPVRLQKFYFVNMSPLGYTMLQLLKIFLSDEVKNRIEIVKGWDQVFKELGTKKFPQHIGGEIPAPEMAQDFKKRLLESQKNILSLNDSDIEVRDCSLNFCSGYVGGHYAGMVGSYRKIIFDQQK